VDTNDRQIKGLRVKGKFRGGRNISMLRKLAYKTGGRIVIRLIIDVHRISSTLFG